MSAQQAGLASGGSDDRSGLTADEVLQRVRSGEVNRAPQRTSRSFADIVRANVFTRFNAILGVLCVAILAVGSPRDALFGLVIVANALIGIVQETRAKLTLDRLSVLSASAVRVVRDGRAHEIPIGDVVLSDVLLLAAGDQVVADGEVLSSEGLEVDESLLTGEAMPLAKEPGDAVMSGSFVVAGSGRFRATRVGEAAYANQLATGARKFKMAPSELRQGTDLILRIVQWVMVPVGLLLLVTQLTSRVSLASAVTGTVAGIVGMVPEGLVLLTSLALALAVVSLGRRRVLVQDLAAVEGLARVDVICLDKTGTLTQGRPAFDHLEVLGPGAGGGQEAEEREALAALAAFAADPAARNATLAAIAERFATPEEGWRASAEVPFSSARKWSAAVFGGHGVWVLGAPEVLLENTTHDEALETRLAELAARGLRVLLLARAAPGEPLVADRLPRGLDPVAVVVLQERIRPDASAALDYFEREGVTLKIMSGDDPRTAATLAEAAGLGDAGQGVDARHLPDDPGALADLAESTTVFGRVTPDGKEAIIRALQSRGHVVGMTGDGVNDVLAVKQADIGVVMGSGAAATKAVADLVLVDGRFAELPHVVAEGRRVIANVERVANLFVTKTVYASLLALAIGLARWPFPFLPRHLTLVGALTIGIPAFFLSLAPTAQRYRPGFVGRVARFAVPSGVLAAAATFAAYTVARYEPGVTLAQSHTVATMVLMLYGLWVLVVVARPLVWWKGLLIATMAAAYAVALATPWIRGFFAFAFPDARTVVTALAIAAAAIGLLETGWRLAHWRRAIG
jgi:cation-transporting P-type ATPase E